MKTSCGIPKPVPNSKIKANSAKTVVYASQVPIAVCS